MYEQASLNPAGKKTNREFRLYQNHHALFVFVYLLLHRIMADTLKATLALQRLGPNTFKAKPFFDRARSGNPHPIA
jgi:hypothetical protein